MKKIRIHFAQHLPWAEKKEEPSFVLVDNHELPILLHLDLVQLDRVLLVFQSKVTEVTLKGTLRELRGES